MQFNFAFGVFLMWIRFVLAVAFMATLPSLVHANSGGAPIRRTGNAFDGGTDCTACHRTFAPANSAPGGFIRITAVNYTPGARQTVRVEVFHPEARRWGFSLTSRLTSDESRKAGVITENTNVQVRCEPSGNAPCGTDREFATHRTASTTMGANGSMTYSFEWQAPDAGAGDVVFYAAGNAADGVAGNGGDRIYTTTLRLSPAPALANPTVTSESAVSAQAFGGGRTIAPGSWIEIFGSNLTNITREWAGFDFTGSNAPTSLEGVRVSVAGRPAFVRFVSPGQVNAQVPDGIGTGPVNVTVTNGAGTSANIAMTAAARAPQVLAPANFRVGTRQYAVATFNDGTTFVARPGEIAGVTSRAARMGDSITLYGVGFGAVLPATAAGAVASGQTSLNNAMVRIGDAPARVTYAGLAPGTVGLYQLNLDVPNVAAGEQRLSVSVDGVANTQELFLVIGQ
jgi:uncharacterized protein (TIGR03437 family)